MSGIARSFLAAPERIAAMSSRTLFQPAISIPMPLPVREKAARSNPFLNALEYVSCGRLTMIAPDGQVREFAGPRKGPVAHMHVYDWNVFDDIIARGEMGLAESYIDGRWGSKDLPAALTFALANYPAVKKFCYGRPWYALWCHIKALLLNGNTLAGSKRNIMAHYDLGNDFYELWLDDSMTYSCALFEGDVSRSLEDAQQAKYKRILRKLNAQPGDHILELGCGWGGFAEAAARQGIEVTGVTLSQEQAEFARKRLRGAKLDHLASIELMDYRRVAGSFDYIVSIGMFEHVGERFWPTYFRTLRKLLNPGGKAMVQSITIDDKAFHELHNHSGFIEQVIFPGGMLPCANVSGKRRRRRGLPATSNMRSGRIMPAPRATGSHASSRANGKCARSATTTSSSACGGFTCPAVSLPSAPGAPASCRPN